MIIFATRPSPTGERNGSPPRCGCPRVCPPATPPLLRPRPTADATREHSRERFAARHAAQRDSPPKKCATKWVSGQARRCGRRLPTLNFPGASTDDGAPMLNFPGASADLAAKCLIPPVPARLLLPETRPGTGFPKHASRATGTRPGDSKRRRPKPSDSRPPPVPARIQGGWYLAAPFLATIPKPDA